MDGINEPSEPSEHVPVLGWKAVEKKSLVFFAAFFVCFLEKEHTDNTADSVRSKIEAAKLVSISAPSEWPVLW